MNFSHKNIKIQNLSTLSTKIQQNLINNLLFNNFN